MGPRKSRRIVKKNDGRDQNILILFLLSKWLFFRFSDPGGKSTLGASESGDAPELIAGTSDFSPGRKVRMGHLAYRKIGKVTGGDFKFLMLKNNIFVLFFCDVDVVMRLRGCVCCMPKFGMAGFPVLRT